MAMLDADNSNLYWQTRSPSSFFSSEGWQWSLHAQSAFIKPGKLSHNFAILTAT